MHYVIHHSSVIRFCLILCYALPILSSQPGIQSTAHRLAVWRIFRTTHIAKHVIPHYRASKHNRLPEYPSRREIRVPGTGGARPRLAPRIFRGHQATMIEHGQRQGGGDDEERILLRLSCHYTRNYYLNVYRIVSCCVKQSNIENGRRRRRDAGPAKRNGGSLYVASYHVI